MTGPSVPELVPVTMLDEGHGASSVLKLLSNEMTSN